MEIKFQNLDAVSVEFPNRKLRNIEEKNWDDSKKKRMFLEKKDVRIDGSTGDVIVDYKIPPYLRDKVARKEININGVFYPDQTDPEIESMLEVQERILLDGKAIHEADPIELIQAGIIKL